MEGFPTEFQLFQAINAEMIGNWFANTNFKIISVSAFRILQGQIPLVKETKKSKYGVKIDKRDKNIWDKI